MRRAAGATRRRSLSPRHEDEDGEWAGVLGALIAAVREADDAAVLVAVLPVGGQTLLERQVRLARGAGATHIVVLVERLPPALIAAIERLRRDGIEVDIARSADDGADRFHPEERVLVVADGAIAPPGCLARLGAMMTPVLLTLGEDGPAGAFERIDSATRWTGVALVSGDTLRRTVAQLGDWDLHSTLLRRIAGGGARRVDVADRADTGRAEQASLVRSRAGARAATAGVLAPDRRREGWPMRFVYMPVARLCVAALLDRPVEAGWLRIAALALALVAAPIAYIGMLAVALPLLLLAAAIEATGRTLDAIRLGRARAGDAMGIARELAAAAVLLAWAAGRLIAGGEPVALAVAAAVVAVMAALRRERGLLHRFAGRRPPPLIADGDALVLLFALAAATGLVRWAPAILLAYAALSFALVQQRLIRAPAPPDGEVAAA